NHESIDCLLVQNCSLLVLLPCAHKGHPVIMRTPVNHALFYGCSVPVHVETSASGVENHSHFQAGSCCSTQCASFSRWQRRHAFGLSCFPKRSVISAFGMSSIWCVRASNSSASMIRGM